MKIAIFWSRIGVWTLTDLEALTPRGKKSELTFADAQLQNEMHLIGDRLIGTVLPLTFRLHAAKDKPRSVLPDGAAPFTIGAVSLLAAGAEVTEALERELTWYMLNYGPWDDANWTAKIRDGEVDFVDFTVCKEQSAEDPAIFSLVGFLSQMISREYIALTSGDEGLRSLLPTIEPDRLGIVISENYEGKALKLWRFQVHPKSK